MSVKKVFTKMHLEALEHGKSETVIFGYKITLAYGKENLVVELVGRRDAVSVETMLDLIKRWLFFSKPVIIQAGEMRVRLECRRADIYPP